MRVLVVDDSRFSRGALRELFEKVEPGCVVTEAQDAATALTVVQECGDFDLITIDLHMPGKDGIALAQELKGQETKGQMALVSANQKEVVQKRAKQLGMMFISKPLNETKIETFVSTAR